MFCLNRDLQTSLGGPPKKSQNIQNVHVQKDSKTVIRLQGPKVPIAESIPTVTSLTCQGVIHVMDQVCLSCAGDGLTITVISLKNDGQVISSSPSSKLFLVLHYAQLMPLHILHHRFERIMKQQLSSLTLHSARYNSARNHINSTQSSPHVTTGLQRRRPMRYGWETHLL